MGICIFKEYEWKPSNNTLVYYPLTAGDGAKDKSGNGFDLTTTSYVTFGVNATAKNVDCAWFNSNGGSSGSCGLYINNSSLVSFGNNYTYVVWLYKGGGSMYYNPRIVGPYGNSLFTYANRDKISVADSTSYGVTPSSGEWFLFVGVYDGSNMKFYKNGEFVNKQSYSRGSYTTTGLILGTRDNLGTGYGDKRDGAMSKVIIEKKLWTDDDIKNYFNRSKSLYGIS